MAYGHSSVGAHKMLADAVGDQSYTYDNMLQYYHKTMDFTPYDYSSTRFANATPEYNEADTVTGGGLGVSYPAYAQPWSTWLSKGLEAIGLKKVPAFINGNLMGQSFHQNTIFHSNGHRSSSESAYLRPAATRRNLFLYDYTMAERILFDRSKTATGVQVNGTCTIKARREVLLSAGVFQSPQLLMVSGVGPKDVLRANNIPVVVDRPGVGQNLQEHIVSFVAYQVNVDTGDRLADPAYLQQAITEFNDHASGPLTSVGGDFMAMEKIPEDLRASWPEVTKQALGRLPADWPEIAYAILPSAIPAEFATPVVPPIPGANYAAAVFVLFAPQSVGNVTIASADVRTPPLINPALFSHPADVDVMVAGLKRVRQALATDDMAPVLIGPETVPGAQVQTDEQIIEFLRSTVNPFQHAFSTNKMGKRNDPSAVVDSNGKVYGVKNCELHLLCILDDSELRLC
jgi:choline dehydrogenase